MFIPCILISVLFISHTTLIRACQYIYILSRNQQSGTQYPKSPIKPVGIVNHTLFINICSLLINHIIYSLSDYS